MSKFLLFPLIAVAITAKADDTPTPAGAAYIEKMRPDARYDAWRSSASEWCFMDYDGGRLPLPIWVHIPANSDRYAALNAYYQAFIDARQDLDATLEGVRGWEVQHKHAMYDANGKYCP